MCVQWCVPVPGVADPDPADGEADGDADADVVDVTDGGDAEPLVAAMATPAVPAPMPAARNAVMIRRRARPPKMDVIWLPPSCGALAGQQQARAGSSMGSGPGGNPRHDSQQHLRLPAVAEG